MPINTAEVLSLVTQICEEKNLRVAVRESVKGGIFAGVTTMLGGLIAGPVGLAIGGTLGGLTAAYLSYGRFKSVASIINNDLTDTQREQLANSVRRIAHEIDAGDIAALIFFIMQSSIKERIIIEVINFFKFHLNMHVER